MKLWIRKYWKVLISLILILGIFYYFCLPDQLFKTPYSTLLESSDGELLSAVTAKDGQWRFPVSDSIPEKFTEALVAFEDKRFWSHPGVDLLSTGRALR